MQVLVTIETIMYQNKGIRVNFAIGASVKAAVIENESIPTDQSE